MIFNDFRLKPRAKALYFAFNHGDFFMTPQLWSAHFQLTGRCNLACSFCGQSRGMLASRKGDLLPEVWLKAAAELKESARAAGKQPEIMLWGGEPLLYEGFGALAEQLSNDGFRLGIVTNGTLLAEHASTLARTMDVINISLDGLREAHDRVRGEGVFDRVVAGLETIRKRKGKLVFLTTLSDANLGGAAELPNQLAPLGPDLIVLQQLMYFSPEEIATLRAGFQRNFGNDYPEIEAWERDDDREYLAKLRREVEIVKTTCYPIPIHFTGHACPWEEEAAPCEAPLNRVHIRHDGAVGFCTDYFGFSAGNITEAPLAEIFRNARAERFRQAVREGEVGTCRHCPWRLQHDFHLAF